MSLQEFVPTPRFDEYRIRHGVEGLADDKLADTGRRADPELAMNALRAGVALQALLLAACDNVLGLQDIVSHTPLAKERCRAQALLWLAEGSDVGEIAELLRVSRQTIYNWLSRFQGRSELDLRARLLDAPRLGRQP